MKTTNKRQAGMTAGLALAATVAAVAFMYSRTSEADSLRQTPTTVEAAAAAGATVAPTAPKLRVEPSGYK